MILKVEDAVAVHLFSRWLNDYFRQLAPELVGNDPVDLRSGEEPAMLAENFRLWRERVFKEGLNSGIEKGKHATAKDIARKLLARGMAPVDVAAVAGISVAELETMLQH